MTTEWIWDDPKIPPDEVFLRRIPRKPAFAVPNLVTKQLEIKAAALRFDEDGMSVSCSRILAEENLDRRASVTGVTTPRWSFPRVPHERRRKLA